VKPFSTFLRHGCNFIYAVRTAVDVASRWTEAPVLIALRYGLLATDTALFIVNGMMHLSTTMHYRGGMYYL